MHSHAKAQSEEGTQRDLLRASLCALIGFEAMASPTAEFKIVPHLAQDRDCKLTLRGQKQINLRRKFSPWSVSAPNTFYSGREDTDHGINF